MQLYILSIPLFFVFVGLLILYISKNLNVILRNIFLFLTLFFILSGFRAMEIIINFHIFLHVFYPILMWVIIFVMGFLFVNTLDEIISINIKKKNEKKYF